MRSLPAFIFALLLATAASGTASERPNIIFVLFDDLGWGQPQSYNATSALRTPNLDRLATQGMRFTDAHTAAAVCTPTRYGVLTGRYPSRLGQFGVLTTFSKPIIPPSRATVASLLKAQGYTTACIGKWHLGMDWADGKPGSEKEVPIGAKMTGGPNALGFDYFYGFTHARNIGTIVEQDHVVAHVEPVENQPLMAKKVVEWLDQRKAGEPFFLYYPLGIPHEPIVPSDEFAGKSGAQDLVKKGPKYGDWLFQGDAMLGNILEALDRNHLAENTLIIVTSDNGAEHRAYAPLRESKRSIYEGGHRVPFVVRWPAKVKPGSVNDHTVCLNDLMATAAEITGAKIPDNAGEDSVSLLPELLGTSKDGTREATIHQSAAGDLALRQGPWKMIFHKDGKRELYNLQTDLSETKDVLAANAEIAQRMTMLMQGYIANGRSTAGPAQKNDFDLSINGDGTTTNEIQEGEMAGYLLVPNEKVPETYNAGFSMYVAAWPLVDQYPGQNFQTGLFGTWMFAQKDVRPRIKLYSDVEGGLGWWRDTEYATETPKFIMGGVAPNFSAWANGPGAGQGRDWNKPKGKYGIAQLSPWLLWPPDGLNLKQGTCGELFGYGYLPLPLTPAKTTTAGTDIPTGDQSWTLFLNTGNFKGPVAFFTPYFWSGGTVAKPQFKGMLLDGRPSNPNRSLQMETQHIPSIQANDAKGETYARVAPTFFPCGTNGESRLVHHITSYNKQALWDSVKIWFDGGAEASGAIHSEGAILHQFTGEGGATWKIYPDGVAKDDKVPLAWASFATPMAADPHTFGYRWDLNVVKQTDAKHGSLVQLPEYFHLVKSAGKPQWVPVRAEEVPAETGLAKARFSRPNERHPLTYVTPDDPASSWKKPGPKAGPFQAKLGDGSVVTYYWYRFADQPALLNADLTDKEREALQVKVEKLHRLWKKDRDYLAPPAFGKLAELDPALILTPPPGLEVGYVPIATRQGLKE